ncbi:MAG: hypothetical protein ACOC4Z_02760 [Patescibacteria group bacterium]
MKKFFSVVLSLIFLFVLFLTTLAFSLENTLFQSDFHTRNFKKINLYQTAATEIVPSLLTQNEESPLEQMPLTEEDLGEIIQQSIPEPWLQSEVEGNLDNAFAYLKGKEKTLDLSINLTPVKSSLAEDFAQNLLHKLQELPPCSQEQMLAMQSGEVDKLECLPPQAAQGDMEQQLSRQFSGMTEEIPEEINLSEQLPADAEAQLEKIQDGYQIFNMARWSLLGLTVGLFLILLLINGENILGYLKGLSITVLILSALSLAARFLIGSNVEKLLARMPKVEDQILNTLRNDLISVTLNSFLSYTTKITLVILAVSVVYLLALGVKNLLQREPAV